MALVRKVMVTVLLSLILYAAEARYNNIVTCRDYKDYCDLVKEDLSKVNASRLDGLREITFFSSDEQMPRRMLLQAYNSSNTGGWYSGVKNKIFLGDKFYYLYRGDILWHEIAHHVYFKQRSWWWRIRYCMRNNMLPFDQCSENFATHYNTIPYFFNS